MAVARPVDSSSHVYLVDGSGYIFRAYHALPPLTRSDGTPIGAVQGFCNMLFKLLEDLKGEDQPTHIAVIFDHSSKTFRNEIYDQYKVNRPEPPEDLVVQFALIREATTAFDLPCIQMEGFEADDLIATYARQATDLNARVTVASSDKDLMQLVNDQVTLLDPMKSRRIAREQVIEKFGVAPDRVVDVQSLAGDSVDNIPGVPGIGVKTAAQLITEYGDLDTLLARAEEIKQPKRRATLINHADDAQLSRKLVTLKPDVPVEHKLDSFGTVEPTPGKLIGFFKAMEFRSLTRRVEGALNASVTDEARNAAALIDRSSYETVQTLEALEGWIEACRSARVIAVDVETDALSAAASRLVGVSLATAPGQACYIPLDHESSDLADGGVKPDQIDKGAALELLRTVLEHPAILKVGQNFKYDLAVFQRHGIRVAPYDDTLLISYVQAAGLHKHGLDELADRHLDHATIKFKDVCGAGKSQKRFSEINLKAATEYAAEDVDVTLRLWKTLKPKMAVENLSTVYETLERPLPRVLTDMELAGVKVDVVQLSRLSSNFAGKMAEAEAAAHTAAGRPFNLGSPKQVGEILFGKMGLPGGRKTKSGAWSTDAAVLDQLAQEGHELPRILLTWRQFSKLKSTYCDGLRDAINPDTGRVHTNFSLAATSTGRLSSSEPNLQNIPLRPEEGRKIREAFVAEPGHVIVAADYSQIELRLLAHIAKVDALKDAFRQGKDIHAMTAAEMFGVPLEEMDVATRRNAKAINFGIIYGISAFGLANNLGIGRDEAKAYIDSYFNKFPGIKDYTNAMKAQARAYGMVSTLFGRRIHLPGIRHKDPVIRQFAERQAINAPIQGAAADIIRRAMARMPHALHQAGLKSRMVLQVHDELVFEAPEAESDTLIPLVREVMSNAALPAVNLSAPLVVEARAAGTWGQAH